MLVDLIIKLKLQVHTVRKNTFKNTMVILL